MKSKKSQKGASNDTQLAFPLNAGRAIVEANAVMACPVLGTKKFVKFCQKCGLSIKCERLLRLERLGLFAPIFRVRKPMNDKLRFNIPVREGNDWFEKGWAWDTTGVPLAHEVPDHEDRTQEGYYSIFQIYYLYMVLQVLTNLIGMDVCLDIDEQKNIDWCKTGESLMQSVKKSADELREHEHSRCVELLCQFVSNKYFPITQTDQRKMRERWINSLAPFISNDYLKFKSTWYEEAQQWQPQTAERLFHLTPKKLRFAYECLARIQEHDDPLADGTSLHSSSPCLNG